MSYGFAHKLHETSSALTQTLFIADHMVKTTFERAGELWEVVVCMSTKD